MSAVSDNLLDRLSDAGFRVHNAGTFKAGFLKQLIAMEMPYVCEHVVDDENVFDSTQVLVEVSITGNVTLTVPDFEGANEGPVSVDSDEGLAILRDAGVKLSS